MDFQSLVDRKLEPLGVSNNDIIYRCPQCEGEVGSGHLYVDYNKGYFHCFKCNFSGKRIEALLKYLNIDVDYDYTKLYSEHNKELDDIIISPRKKIDNRVLEYSTDLDVLTEYYNMHTKPLSNEAYQYLLSRKLSPELISTLDIREGVNHYNEKVICKYKELEGRDYSGRIIVPSRRRDGRISFYVARDYTGTKDAKYKNPPKELLAASEDVWSLDIIETPNIIICEGVFTAIAVNQALGKLTACATYGKSIAQNSSSDISARVTSQGEKLLSRHFKNYIVFYDKDAWKESYDTARYLYERGASVRIVNIPHDMYGPKADAADMTRDEVIACIQNSAVYDRFSELF